MIMIKRYTRKNETLTSNAIAFEIVFRECGAFEVTLLPELD